MTATAGRPDRRRPEVLDLTAKPNSTGRRTQLRSATQKENDRDETI
jgi:hypothetical protein